MDVQVDWPSTEAEWDRAEAREIGAAHPERAWVSTDRDVWHRNPFYSGPEVPILKMTKPCSSLRSTESKHGAQRRCHAP